MKISVVICTHNPHTEYFRRVLNGLLGQTLGKEEWELLIVDNASEDKLSEIFKLSWHPNARYIREDEIGLTIARLRGINESHGELVIFVDDDNVLDITYLESALAIADKFGFLGAWGGSLIGDFEITPPRWAKPYLWSLAVREITVDRWSNDPNHNGSLPLGAGLCVRRNIAEAYVTLAMADPLRRRLDRVGQQLLGGGDIDLARMACRAGLGTGVFSRLTLKHLIPARRLELDYLSKMVESSSASVCLLNHLEGKSLHDTHRKFGSLVRLLLNRLTMSPQAWALYRAHQRGPLLASRFLRESGRI